jgi:hypothetical protein
MKNVHSQTGRPTDCRIVWRRVGDVNSVESGVATKLDLAPARGARCGTGEEFLCHPVPVKLPGTR